MAKAITCKHFIEDLMTRSTTLTVPAEQPLQPREAFGGCAASTTLGHRASFRLRPDLGLRVLP